MGIYQCDDGNKNNSDGCSSACIIEDGWECSGGSEVRRDVCVDVVAPSMHIIRNKNNSLLTIKFSENVIYNCTQQNCTQELQSGILLYIQRAGKDVHFPWELMPILNFTQIREIKLSLKINFTTTGDEVST